MRVLNNLGYCESAVVVLVAFVGQFGYQAGSQGAAEEHLGVVCL